MAKLYLILLFAAIMAFSRVILYVLVLLHIILHNVLSVDKIQCYITDRFYRLQKVASLNRIIFTIIFVLACALVYYTPYVIQYIHGIEEMPGHSSITTNIFLFIVMVAVYFRLHHAGVHPFLSPFVSLIALFPNINYFIIIPCFCMPKDFIQTRKFGILGWILLILCSATSILFYIFTTPC